MPIVERAVNENAVGSKRWTPEDDRENGGRWLTENATGKIDRKKERRPKA